MLNPNPYSNPNHNFILNLPLHGILTLTLHITLCNLSPSLSPTPSKASKPKFSDNPNIKPLP